ncbi:MAG: HD domain-containing phosphohydrolase [Actinomycetota bacterium]|nr:HD domain-containing phosphohydrolase [Actinomycetota bacterium]
MGEAASFLEREIEVLSEVSSLVTLGDGAQTILRTLVGSALGLLQAESGSLMLHEEKGDYLVIAAAQGIPPEIAARTRVKVGEGVAGWVAKTGKPLLLVEGSDDPRLFELHQTDRTKDAISVPVSWEANVLGVLNINNKKEGTFSKADLAPLVVFANQAAVVLHERRRHLAVDEAYLNMITTLAGALDARDIYTFGHSKAVRDYSLGIGKQLNLDPSALRRIELAALLHDLGKLSIPDSVLLKKGSLDDEEYTLIKTHPRMGARILEPIEYLADLVPGILHHHERYDGRGYPDGLKGEAIPPEARILAIADAFDSMSSKRGYRSLLTTEKILSELRQGRGRQFDPRMLDVFLREFAIDRRIYRAGKSRLGDDIHQAFNYYSLAVRDSPAEVERTIALMAGIIGAFLATVDKYAGPHVKDRIVKKLNNFSIEHRLDLLITDDRPDTAKLRPATLVELSKRFQAYLDYLLTVTSAALSVHVNDRILKETREKFGAPAAELFNQAAQAGHFG